MEVAARFLSSPDGRLVVGSIWSVDGGSLAGTVCRDVDLDGDAVAGRVGSDLHALLNPVELVGSPDIASRLGEPLLGFDLGSEFDETLDRVIGVWIDGVPWVVGQLDGVQPWLR